jgi:membrane fusion protein (multidrug efflux system)
MNPPPAEPAPEYTAPKSKGPRNIALLVLGVVAVALGAFFGWRHLVFSMAHEETDDAQVEGDISPVLPRISGYVGSVLVRDNARVAAGDPLIEIDAKELDLKCVEAAAALKSAEASWATSKAALANALAAEAVAAANVATAEVTRAKAASDLVRDTSLFRAGAITDSQLADTRAAADIAAARYEAIRRQADAAATESAAARTRIGAAQAVIAQRQADADYAALQRSYATVSAPIAGLVSHKSVEPGQFVQAGQTLLSIASDNNPWVVANFKETQLNLIRAGQAAEFTADSYPGITFHGRVDSLGGATGARFALLPPDNASGNYVKVTQRVPVKIVVTDPPDPAHILRPGMSVDVAVRTRD